MKKLLSKVSLTIATLSIGAVGLFPSLAVAAGNAGFSLSPSGGSHVQNASFTVKIYENSGSEPVNTIEADLTYPQARLQFVSVSTAGSPFTSCLQSSGGGGSISIVCALLGGSITGSQFVGNVTFKTLVGSGTATVALAQSSMVVSSASNTDIWNHSDTGGTYTLAASAPSPVARPSTPAPSDTSAVVGDQTQKDKLADKQKANTPAASNEKDNETSSWIYWLIAAGLGALAAAAYVMREDLNKWVAPAVKKSKKSYNNFVKSIRKFAIFKIFKR